MTADNSLTVKTFHVSPLMLFFNPRFYHANPVPKLVLAFPEKRVHLSVLEVIGGYLHQGHAYPFQLLRDRGGPPNRSYNVPDNYENQSDKPNNVSVHKSP